MKKVNVFVFLLMISGLAYSQTLSIYRSNTDVLTTTSIIVEQIKSDDLIYFETVEHDVIAKERGVDIGKIVSDGERVVALFNYKGKEGEHGNRLTCLDINTGNIVWSKPQLIKETNNALILKNDIVISMDRLFDVNTGEELLNLQEEYSNLSNGKELGGGENWLTMFDGNIIIRFSNNSASDSFLFDLNENKGKLIKPVEAVDSFVSKITKGFFFLQTDDGKDFICLTHKLSEEAVWKTEINSFNQHTINSEIYIDTKEELVLLNSYTGQEQNRIAYSELSQNLTSGNIHLYFTNDLIYVVSVYKYSMIVAINRHTFNLVWQKDIYDYGYALGENTFDGFEKFVPVGKGCIGGDLLFMSLGQHGKRYFVAIDRYSGELVWTYENAVDIFNAIAINNKVIFTSTTAGMVCFDCNGEYISSAK